MMRLDLVDLRLFMQIAEASSITGGAAKANLSLAAASERVRGMEERLGLTLLERGRRGVRPTPAGRTLLRHAPLVLQQVERMTGELAKYAKGLKGHVRLVANSSALSELLPGDLEGFLEAHPDIDVDVEEQSSYDIVRLVAEGFADVGIVADLGGLESFPFATDRLVLVMAHAHPLAAHRTLSFRDALDHDFVGLGTTSALQRHLSQNALRAGCALRLRARLGSFDAVCRMVEKGIGLAIVPVTAARRSRRAMAIRLTRLAEPWALRRLSVCVRRLDALPLYAQQLVQHLSRRAGCDASAARST
jgi:DNA-binding transcriptional LysR family regulator